MLAPAPRVTAAAAAAARTAHHTATTTNLLLLLAGPSAAVVLPSSLWRHMQQRSFHAAPSASAAAVASTRQGPIAVSAGPSSARSSFAAAAAAPAAAAFGSHLHHHYQHRPSEYRYAQPILPLFRPTNFRLLVGAAAAQCPPSLSLARHLSSSSAAAQARLVRDDSTRRLSPVVAPVPNGSPMRDDPRRCASPSAVNYSSSSVGSPRKAGGGVQPPPPAAEDDGSDDAGNAGEPPKRGFRALTREFGPIALGVYLCVTSVFFVGCLTSIYVIGIDRDSILAVLKRAKALVGLSDKKKDAEEAAEEAENKKHIKEGARSFMDVLPDWLKTPAVQTLATNVLLAMAMTKLFLPIKLTIVAFLTPTVARRLRSMGFDFGTRGYREMARDASGRVKERLKKNQ